MGLQKSKTRTKQHVAVSLGTFRMVTHLADVAKLEVCGWGRTEQHSTQKEPISFKWFCRKAWVTSHSVCSRGSSSAAFAQCSLLFSLMF